MEFPDPQPGTDWLSHTFNCVMDDNCYTQVRSMYGFVRIRFNQRQMVWPTLLSKLSCGAHTTLTYVMEGSGYYPIPQVLHAYDRGCEVWLESTDHVMTRANHFLGYMTLFLDHTAVVSRCPHL